jgi:hypothetical protein
LKSAHVTPQLTRANAHFVVEKELSKRKTEKIFDAGKEVGLEVYTKRTIGSCLAVRIHIKP